MRAAVPHAGAGAAKAIKELQPGQILSLSATNQGNRLLQMHEEYGVLTCYVQKACRKPASSVGASRPAASTCPLSAV